MRILLLTSELLPEHAGGVATYTATIAPALASLGHEVHVLSCAPNLPFSDQHRLGVWWHRRPMLFSGLVARYPKFLQSGRRLASMTTTLREARKLGFRYDVVETPDWMALSLLLSRTNRAPLVVSLHTPLHVLSKYNEIRMDRDRRFADRLERLQLRNAQIAVSASQVMADELLREGWVREPPRIIRYPVDIDSFQALDPPIETPPNVLYVGRLEQRKAPETLVDAASALRQEVPDIQLTFFGSSNGFREGKPYGEWIRERAESLGVKATFVERPALEDISASYGAARVVAVSSRFESFSIVALEAMAAARPVVCTSTAGAAELIDRTETGTVVPPGDADAFAAALRPFVMDAELAAKSGLAGRALVKQECDPVHIARQRQACYEDAMAAL